MSKWYKYENVNGIFYSPFTRSGSTHKLFPSMRDAVDFINSTDDSTQLYSNGMIVEVYNSTIPANEEVDLPLGVYNYYSGDPETPDRLVPFIQREDSYIDILDSLNNVDSEIDMFLTNKEMYDSCKAMYKFGVLLFGPPGTGKSTYLRRLASKHKAIVIYLTQVPSASFLERLNIDTKDILKIFVFEEVVSSMDDTREIRRMLDFLDGSRTVSNALYLMSTNHPEEIPENVIRNGRIDCFAHVGYPESEARKTLIKLYLSREAEESEVESTKNMPIVDIRHVCFMHKKTSKSFPICVSMIKEKTKMIQKHFGKTQEIKLF